MDFNEMFGLETGDTPIAREPSAGIRKMTEGAHEIYTALVMAGFSEGIALYIVNNMMIRAVFG